MAICPCFDPFWTNFGTHRPKIGGNQLSEVSENDLNELSGLENGVVGRKMSILTHLVWIIWQFHQFWTNFGTPGPKLAKILRNFFLEVLEIVFVILFLHENMAIDTKFNLNQMKIQVLQPECCIWDGAKNELEDHFSTLGGLLHFWSKSKKIVNHPSERSLTTFKIQSSLIWRSDLPTAHPNNNRNL